MNGEDTVMEQLEKVVKGLQTAVDSDWMWQKADYIAMICKDAIALIKQQQERIRELEAWLGQLNYNAAVEMQEYCERYEPTYNTEDGSM